MCRYVFVSLFWQIGINRNDRSSASWVRCAEVFSRVQAQHFRIDTCVGYFHLTSRIDISCVLYVLQCTHRNCSRRKWIYPRTREPAASVVVVHLSCMIEDTPGIWSNTDAVRRHGADISTDYEGLSSQTRLVVGVCRVANITDSKIENISKCSSLVIC